MECPKCGFEIDEKTLVCPNCKKVLKLVCPICKTINTTNTCKRCGYVIVSKCNHCGKINQTISKKCSKCGFSTEQSVILNESNTDDFVVALINFPNLDDIRNILGSAQLFNRFKINLDAIINDTCKSIGIRRQLYKNTYAIRFSKDYSMSSSAKTAVKTIIDMLNKVLTMNAKLSKRKNSSLRCNAFLLKRNVNDDPNNLEVGYNINLLYQDSKDKEQKILNTFQLIAESEVADKLKDNYKLSMLTNTLVGDKMKSFYELDVKDLINIDMPEDETDADIEVPNFVQNMLIDQESLEDAARNTIIIKNDPDAIYDVETINFNEIKCEFIRTQNADITLHLMSTLKEHPHGIIALKANELYRPYSINILNIIEDTQLYKNIIPITCYDEMKYAPYSFFSSLIASVFEYAVSQKLFSTNDYSVFSNIDSKGLMKDLISLSAHDNGENSREIRYTYFNIFVTLIKAIPDVTILIEEFDKIDSSSYDVMKYLFQNFEDFKVNYVLTFGQNYTLHKDCHFLLNKDFYTEIYLKPTQFLDMIENDKEAYKNILDTFYFHRIAKYACGSTLYLDTAMQYLIEAGVYSVLDGVVKLEKEQTLIIPSNLDKLIGRRLNLLQDDENAIKFLVSVMLLGPRIDLASADSLEIPESPRILNKLQEMGIMYMYNNCIHFPNYNLVKRNLINVIRPVYLKEIANNLLDKTFVPNLPSFTKAYLYEILEDYDKALTEWEALADLDLNLGDFTAYINSTQKILNYIDLMTNDENRTEMQKRKSEIYKKISDNMYEYIPEKTKDIAQTTLLSLQEEENTDEKIINMCNRMIQGDLTAGNYMHALELTHKILSLLPAASLSPAYPNFNSYFYMMSLIHIQILFNIGALNECLEVGYRVLDEVKDSTIAALKPETYKDDEFEKIIIDSVGFVALANVLSLKGNIQQFLEITRNDFTKLPQSYSIFIQLEMMIRGTQTEYEIYSKDTDKFTQTLYYFMNAFARYQNNPDEFAQEIYKAKLVAHDNYLHSLELFADSLVGWAYTKLRNFKKAKDILYKVLKNANEDGLTLVVYITWYILCELYLMTGRYDVAYGIANNSLIQLEKADAPSDYLLMLFKYCMYKVMTFKNEPEKAQICIGQAKYIANKYQINFNFDENKSHYIPIEPEPDENEITAESSEIKEDETNTDNNAENNEENSLSESEDEKK